MEKASEKKGLRNICGYSHGKPQLGEALGRGVCGEVSSHPEAFGHRFHYCWGPEALASPTTLTTVTQKAGILLHREGVSGPSQGLWADPGTGRTEATRAQAREGPLHFLAHTSFLLLEEQMSLGPWPQLPASF